MRRRRNGFTNFVGKLDGNKVVEPDYYRPGFHVPTKYWEPLECIPKLLELIGDIEFDGGVSLLIDAFNWRSSPQGYSYWDAIYEGVTEIDEEGMAYLYWLAEQE